MHTETVSAECLRLLNEIGNLSLIEQFYLVGGTSLSLQLGHRMSEDLDFFSKKEFNFKVISLDAKTRFGKANVKVESSYGIIINGVKIDFVFWAYPPHYKFIRWNRLNLMDKRDIGLFKIMALTGRNRKKDIVDLYFIDKEVIDLELLFNDFVKKYDKGDINLFKNIQNLLNQDEVNASPMPEMIKEINFDEAFDIVKTKLLNSIKNYFNL